MIPTNPATPNRSACWVSPTWTIGAAYGLTRDEPWYILVPKDVYRPDFPGETFRVLKEKEEKQFGDASQSDEAACVGGVG